MMAVKVYVCGTCTCIHSKVSSLQRSFLFMTVSHVAHTVL